MHWNLLCDVNCLYRHWSTLFGSGEKTLTILVQWTSHGKYIFCCWLWISKDNWIIWLPIWFSLIVSSRSFSLAASTDFVFATSIRKASFCLSFHFPSILWLFLLFYINILLECKHKCLLKFTRWKPKSSYWFIKLATLCAMAKPKLADASVNVYVWLFLFYFYSPSEKLQRQSKRNWIPSKKTPYLFIRLFKDSRFLLLLLVVNSRLRKFPHKFIYLLLLLGLNCFKLWVVNDANGLFFFAFILKCYRKLLRFTLHYVVAVVWFNLCIYIFASIALY